MTSSARVGEASARECDARQPSAPNRPSASDIVVHASPPGGTRHSIVTRPAHALVLLAVACAKKPDAAPPPEPSRCEVDVGATGLFATTGQGASAQVITDDRQLIGG